MSADEESLTGLTCLVNELFEGPPLARINQIQEVLAAFERQENAWHSAIYYICHTPNEKVMMYCLKLIENVVLKKWVILDAESKSTIRRFLEDFLIGAGEGTADKANFLLNKGAKVLVDIARSDWPAEYPDFFVKVCRFLDSSNRTDLGLLLLHMASEEMVHPSETVNSGRRLAIQQALAAEVPVFLRVLTGLVLKIFGEAAVSGVLAAFQSFEEAAFQAVLNAGTAIFQLDQGGLKICRLFLACLSSLYTWIPLDTEFQECLLVGVALLSLASHSLSPGWLENAVLLNEIGILALNCIQELLERKDKQNRGMETYLRHVLHTVFCHLLLITKLNRSVSEEYQIKLTEILRFLMSKFFSAAMEKIPEFPAVDFLSALKEFTFKSTKSLSLYFPCLEVWKVYLDSLRLKYRSFSDKTATQLQPEDKATVVDLSETLLAHCLFNEAGKHLNELEDDISDAIDTTADDCEYRAFLKESCNLLYHICEFCPARTLQFLSTRFFAYCRTYRGVSGVRIGEHEMRSLHWTLRDLATTMQALGTLADHLKTPCCRSSATDMIKTLVDGLIYGCEKRFYLSRVVDEREIRLDFVEVQAQNFASLQAFIGVFFSLSANRADDYGVLEDAVQLDYLVKMTNAIARSLSDSEQTAPRIRHAATSLLFSICISLHPPQLIHWPAFHEIYALASSVQYLDQLDMTTARLLVQSISCYLLMESSVVTQERDLELEGEKLKLHRTLLQSIGQQRINEAMLVSDRKKFQWAVILLTDIVNSTDLLSSYSRRSCKEALDRTDLFSALTSLTRRALGDAETCVIYLNFFITFTRCFANVMQQSVVGLIDALLTEFNSQTALETTSVVESLLSVLLIVIDHRQVFIPLVENILKLCLFHIYPILVRSEEPDGKLALYRVFFAILNNGFSHFFRAARPTSILDGLTRKSFGTPGTDGGPAFTPDHLEEFGALMQAIAAAFYQTDIEVVRANLEGLMKLNDSRRLFAIPYFRTNILPEFQRILLDCLLAKNFDLLVDSVRQCLFAMATSSTSSAADGEFFQQFLPAYIHRLDYLDAGQKTSLLSGFSRDTDLPTFCANLELLVNDARFYRMCNESLQKDSVVFTV